MFGTQIHIIAFVIIVIQILFFAFIAFFILPYLVTKDFTYARQVFTIIPIVMMVAFMFRAFKAIKGSIKEAGNEDDRCV